VLTEILETKDRNTDETENRTSAMTEVHRPSQAKP